MQDSVHCLSDLDQHHRSTPQQGRVKMVKWGLAAKRTRVQACLCRVRAFMLELKVRPGRSGLVMQLKGTTRYCTATSL